jgi:hypothetical protein
MLKLFSQPRFLALDSAVLTVAFVTTVAFDFVAHSTRPVQGAEQHDYRQPDFDQLTVHRINIVEPDGTVLRASSSPIRPSSPAASIWERN